VPHIKNSVTAPEVSLCLAEKISQEVMHNQSSQYIIETVILSDRRSQVYEFGRSNRVPKQRCKFIAGLYPTYVDDPTPEYYFVWLLADYLLEGMDFYNGFIFFYNLVSRMLMSGIADTLE
jgi:ribonucleoside-diphosphate reductase beta chain